MRVVLDTNVLVSFLLGGAAAPAEFKDAWNSGQLEVVVSRPLLDEVLDVLARPKLARIVGPRDRDDLLFSLATSSVLAAVAAPYPDAPDPNDGFLLATALAGGASAIVTGDRALLALERWGGVAVLTPRGLVEQLDALAGG